MHRVGWDRDEIARLQLLFLTFGIKEKGSSGYHIG
jgi:hypothetical protein